MSLSFREVFMTIDESPHAPQPSLPAGAIPRPDVLWCRALPKILDAGMEEVTLAECANRRGVGSSDGVSLQGSWAAGYALRSSAVRLGSRPAGTTVIPSSRAYCLDPG